MHSTKEGGRVKYEIPNIPKLVYAEKESRIQVYPTHTNRASSLGYFVPELEGCMRRGVYERTSWQEKEPHDGKLQAIFDEGNEQERIILRDVMKTEADIVETQRAYSWPEYQITGHIDGKLLSIDENGQSVGIPIEIKSMSPNIFTTVHTFDDFKKKPWTRSYMMQIMLYMMMESIDTSVFLLKNKSTGELKQILVNLDYEMAEWGLKTAEAINKHVADKTLPDKITDIDKCARCPYKLKCQPDVNFGNELLIADDPAFYDKVHEWQQGKTEAKRIENLYKNEIRPKAVATANLTNGNLNLLMGNYHLTGKKNAKGTFLLKVSSAFEE